MCFLPNTDHSSLPNNFCTSLITFVLKHLSGRDNFDFKMSNDMQLFAKNYYEYDIKCEMNPAPLHRELGISLVHKNIL